jgi:glutamate/tyrosine decarboxylase-like PLP-dependent enzyme
MLNDPVPGLLRRATEALEAEFAALPDFEPATESAADTAAMARVLEAAAHRLGNNYPYFHPLYAGQMLKPPHPLARAAYALAMKINPNNHARDGGRASSEMEIEAVAAIAGIFGWTEFLGHLASSGTLANLEALWVAGKLAPGRRIVGSEQAHYTHRRISAVLKLEYAEITTDDRGRMNMDALEAELRNGDVGTVVVTLGTTAVGAMDPLDEVLRLRERYAFRVHVDAAYGGYFRLIPEALEEPARRAFAAMGEADSIVIDPHKHGLQPYGCGCVLFRDPAAGRFYKHDSPYTYFTSKQLHLHPSEQKSLAGDPGRHFQRETSRRGETVLYELQGSRPPLAIERRIATEHLPYGGKWSFTLEPVDGGTKVRITEDGEVYNPIFRFVSRFVMGHTAMLDAYLKALGKAVGQDVRIEN